MLRRSRRILFQVCLAFTDRHPDSVDNLYQEMVLNLWRGWHKFHGKSNETTWVYRVALNTALVEYRKSKSIQAARLVALDENIVDTLADETDPIRELLYELIDKLDDIDKEIIFLYLDHNSYAQIASITGYSIVSVKYRIASIKNKLILLKQQNEEQDKK